MGRDWSGGVPDQDSAAITWVKHNALFVAEVGGGAADDRIAQDPVVCQIHGRLRDLARALADRLAVPATDPDIEAERHPIAERARALAEGLAIETDAVPGRIGDLYSAIQTLGGSRDALRRLREVRTNAPDPLSPSEYADLNDLVTQAALWIRQFPRARDLDAGSVIPSDLLRLIPLAQTIITAAQAAHLIGDADADRILSPLADATGATPETQSRAVRGARNLLYRLGTFALGFIPDPVLPGDAADNGVANALAGMLVDQSDGITAFLRDAPREVGEAFGRLIAISGEFGLHAPVRPPMREPPAPAEPEAAFSLDEVKRRILAGEIIPAAWVPLVTQLDLSATNLIGVRPLGALTALQSLDLRSTHASDVTPLGALAALQSLNLRDTPVSDVTPLGALTALQSLNLRSTTVSDVRPLGALTALQSLDLGFTHVSDVRPLGALTALQSLDLWAAWVSDVTPLGALTALQSLKLTFAQVSDVTPLGALTALQSLDLMGTQVSDVRPLGALIALQSLNLFGTQVSDVTPLGVLTALRSLDLGGTQVSDVTPLGVLTALQFLDLGGTRVSDVTPLGVLTTLQTLDLTSTPVSDVTPLASLKALKKLVLTRTRPTGVDVLRRPGLTIRGGPRKPRPPRPRR